MNLSKIIRSDQNSKVRTTSRALAVGLGGAGNDLLTHIMEANLPNVYCIAADTDRYHLQITKAHSKIPISTNSNPGKGSGESDDEDLRDQVRNMLRPIGDEVDVVFVLVGMGGTTGNAVAPFVAEAARRTSAVIVGLVTNPFHFEREKFHIAVDDMRQMLTSCDTVIPLDNNLLEHTPITLPFKLSVDSPSQTCCSIVNSITHTFAHSALSKADLAEFRIMLRRGGLAKVCVGHSYSHFGAEEAALKALRNTTALGELTNANGVFVNIAGSHRVEHAHLAHTLELLSRKINPSAQVLYSHRIDPAMGGITSVTLLATGVSFPFTWGGYRLVPLEIYELEPDSSAEGKLSIELELDQLENFTC